ncbi:DUF202 domain-containing protein [Algoriphagus lacus]|mgnify:CR=1 FL=1|uniref:DUF202 domain-containing protein n=1 Tax=Algoriphagus lacus TaxID=2056311 RepID=A0A418PVW7_9BACT|nr:DUF202 domain-containing protein [Algoriphagus lacus]RIW18327.1 DUF202 domain-containing protein [Algoriphagus lacus]
MDDLLEEKDGGKPLKKKAKKLIQLERTRTAFERLQLAWVRTSITILAFGVGVYEFFFNRLESGKTPLFEAFTGRELALVLYSISFIILILSLLQHLKSMRILKKSFPESRYSVAALLSVLLLLLAFFLVSLLLWKAYNP